MSTISPLLGLWPSSTEIRHIGDTDVPWTYGSLTDEYRSLRTKAGLFDHSSLGLIQLAGEAVPFLQSVLARDVEYLRAERCLMGLLLDDDGQPLDLVTLYGLEDGVLLETSFGRGMATMRYLEHMVPADVSMRWIGDTHTVIGVEGPYSWGVVGRIVDQELTALPYESVVETEWDGHSVLFARSGFTGEYGYKLIADHDLARRLWEALVDEVDPVGFGVLETAMLEVRQPILHRETGGVLEAGLNWLVDITKEEFPGRAALAASIDAGAELLTVGFATAVVPPPGASVFAAGVPIGTVTYAVHSPVRAESVGLARVASRFAAAGLDLTIGVDGDGAQTPARTISAPYVVPMSWSVPVF